MKNGATIILESSWALNLTETREAVTTLCGTKGGAEPVGGLTLNGVKNGRQYTLVPSLQSGGVAFYKGISAKPEDIEAHTFHDAIRGKGKLYVLPEQAFAVTKILEGIYKSAASGKPHYFEKE